MWGEYVWGSADVWQRNSWNFAVSKHFPVCLCSHFRSEYISFFCLRNTSLSNENLPPQMCGLKSQNNHLVAFLKTWPPLCLTHRIPQCCLSLLWCCHAGICHCVYIAGGLKKREFYRQNHCLIPWLAISCKLLSIQIKVSNLLLQKLPGEAVVHLKSSKWDIYHLKKSPDHCLNKCC